MKELDKISYFDHEYYFVISKSLDGKYSCEFTLSKWPTYFTSNTSLKGKYEFLSMANKLGILKEAFATLDKFDNKIENGEIITTYFVLPGQSTHYSNLINFLRDKLKIREELMLELNSFERSCGDLNALAMKVHEAAVDAGWWTDLKTGECLKNSRNVGEHLMLIVSEISEAMEGHRKGLMDDKLPHRSMLEVELADAIIRILDLCGSKNLDISGAIIEKMEYNKNREDHKIENRLKEGGKAY